MRLIAHWTKEEEPLAVLPMRGGLRYLFHRVPHRILIGEKRLLPLLLGRGLSLLLYVGRRGDDPFVPQRKRPCLAHHLRCRRHAHATPAAVMHVDSRLAHLHFCDEADTGLGGGDAHRRQDQAGAEHWCSHSHPILALDPNVDVANRHGQVDLVDQPTNDRFDE